MTRLIPQNHGHFKYLTPLFPAPATDPGNVGQAAHNLPPSIPRKGAVFLCEAIWMSSKPQYPSCAVKISVGGVNALTGLRQNQSVKDKQDYVVVGGDNGQKWLDGFAGYTVEGQVTGKEVCLQNPESQRVVLAEAGLNQDIGGIQIDVFEQ